jgi:ATP-dependent RNA helicase DDX54/DBP10
VCVLSSVIIRFLSWWFVTIISILIDISIFLCCLSMCSQHLGLKSTLIYGAMDPEARNQNLRRFRNKEVSYLIVTDLAARGLDVPLLNNVINFHCPAQPKMFVHRCGRAARAGRIGFAFSLIEPEELGYMMDIHTMLGKEMEVVGSGITGDISKDRPASHQEAYTLATMQPSMVHTGIFPQDVIHEEADSFDRLMKDTEELRILWRISCNGMKQYRRTRAEASRHGIKLTKAAVKNNVIKYIHPLIAGEDSTRCSSIVIEKANFVQHLQSFRPAQTVFETGIGTGTTGAGFKVKGANKMNSTSGKVDSAGVEAMRALRRQVAPALERNKAKAITIEECALGEGKETVEGEEEDGEENDEYHNDDDEEEEEGEGGDATVGHGHGDEVPEEIETDEPSTKKRRLSKADRKKMKKHGGSMRSSAQSSVAFDDNIVSGGGQDSNNKQSATFMDNKYYMSYGTEDEVATYREDLLQPQQGLRSSEAIGAVAIENAMMDIAPDDAMEMNKKKKITRWDAKKRKFVQQTLEEMSQSKHGQGKIRSESGVMRHSKSSKPQGEMYNDWKKKTRREVSIAGTGDEDYGQPKPNWRVNRKVPEELKNAQQIRKAHKEKDNMKMKNMSKDKRKSMAGNKKKSAAEAQAHKFSGSKAGQRKVRLVMR